MCKHAGCCIWTVPESLNCRPRGSLGIRKEQQSRPPGVPYPVLQGTISTMNVAPDGIIPEGARKYSVE